MVRVRIGVRVRIKGRVGLGLVLGFCSGLGFQVRIRYF